MELLKVLVDQFDIKAFLRESIEFAKIHSDIGTNIIYDMLNDEKPDWEASGYSPEKDDRDLYILVSTKGAEFYFPFSSQVFRWKEDKVPCLDGSSVKVLGKNGEEMKNVPICQADYGSSTLGYNLQNLGEELVFRTAICDHCSDGPATGGDVIIDECNSVGPFEKPMKKYLEKFLREEKTNKLELRLVKNPINSTVDKAIIK